MAMPVHEVWFLLALALIIGGFGGSLIGNWWAQRQCCECCTCENCEPAIEGRVLPLEPRPVQMSDFWDDNVSNLELHAVQPEQPFYGTQIDAERPDTGTWLRTQRMWMERSYPIPGTPQWEARHPVGVS